MPQDCEYCCGACECPQLYFEERREASAQKEPMDEKLIRAAAEAVRAYQRVMNDAAVASCVLPNRAVVV